MRSSVPNETLEELYRLLPNGTLKRTMFVISQCRPRRSSGRGFTTDVHFWNFLH
ncbi:hypothetical protein NECAME_10149 [Necator americanus]|uniref:Uncharacterized protein n=1 Tax=Necator americanus TaxID=51031 RepID=W2TCS0_NECAM|nr:hypothetical protein NECAME_10149 [Necator americanus]ETN78787.1 hypothetical protein NECAME_10149 [Necator americanus]